MSETYAALTDANGDVTQVIVIPPGTADAAAYCASIGLAGEWRDCPYLPGLGWRSHGGEYYPHWVQIAGAGLGLDGQENGYVLGTNVWHLGAAWESRIGANVNEPFSDGTPTTWSRKDGTYVTPAGWEYQVGEELTEGGKWYRVTQATSFAPSASPSQYVEITGPGGEVVVPPEPEVAAWVQPTGTGNAYAIGDEVTHANAQDGGAVWLFRSKIAGNTTEPGTDGTFHRWWEPVSAV